MYPVTPAAAICAPRRQGGFTLIELMVGLTILSITLAVGWPAMSGWLTATRAQGASEFYAEGLRLARAEAMKRGVVSRLTLLDNATSGQQDWQVDICLPGLGVTCHEAGSSWSTVSAPATTSDPADTRGADFRSVFRKSNSLPGATVMKVTRFPGAATGVYFTPLGWVDSDPTVAPALSKLQIAPGRANAGAFPAAAVAITLAGAVSKCDPAQPVTDSRGCPP
jgi:type IV fimbrial biogenesis protein FimT